MLILCYRFLGGAASYTLLADTNGREVGMASVTQIDVRPDRTALRRRTADDLRAEALALSTRPVYNNHIRRWLAWWGGREGEPNGVDVA